MIKKPSVRRRRPAGPLAAVMGLSIAAGELLGHVWKTNRRRLPLVIILLLLALIIGYSALIAPLTPFLYPLF